MSFTVLITAAGGPLSAAVIRAMKASARHDIRVVAVDMRADATGGRFADRFATVPRGDAPGYVERIAELVRAEAVDLVLPCSDEEALALARGRDAIEAGSCRLACADHATLRFMADKGESYAFLAERGIAVPRFARAATAGELAGLVDEFAARGEFAVKPARSRGNRDIYVVRADLAGVEPMPSRRELHMDVATFRRDHLPHLAAKLPLLVMERLLAPAYDVDVLSWQGKALRVVPRRRLNPEGVPFLGNVVTGAARLIDLGARIAAATGLSWLYDFDLMTARDGTPTVLELNPRPSGSMIAAVAAGVPLLDDLVSLAKGETLPPCTVPAERTIVPFTCVAEARG